MLCVKNNVIRELRGEIFRGNRQAEACTPNHHDERAWVGRVNRPPQPEALRGRDSSSPHACGVRGYC